MPSSTSGVVHDPGQPLSSTDGGDVPRSLPQEATWPRTGSLPTGDPRAPADPGHPRGRPGHCPTISTTTAKSKPSPPLALHSLRQLRAPGSDSGRPRAGHGHGGRPRRPRPSQPCGGPAHRCAPRPHFVGHSERGERSDTGRPPGHRTPGRSAVRTRTLDTSTVDRHRVDTDTGL
jgi:hypothetical protein